MNCQSSGGKSSCSCADRVVSSMISHSDLFLSDRKSTRLNSSHLVISYAVFCLKKKNITVFFSFIIHVSHTNLPSANIQFQASYALYLTTMSLLCRYLSTLHAVLSMMCRAYFAS